MIHQVSATSVLPRDETIAATYSISNTTSINHHTHTQMEIVKLEVPWIDVHMLVVL